MPKSTSLKSIPQFYAGKSVFLTGGTGFLGKVIVEKLLRSCPDIERIFLLTRVKKGKSIGGRFDELLNSPAFSLLRETNPKMLEKIVMIEGDVTKDSLGLSEADQQLLRDEVSIYIHVGATVSFIESLKIAVMTNLKSVKEIMGLARNANHLDAFVYVSTAYTNWFESDNETKMVKEEIYPNILDPNAIIDLVRETPEDELCELTPVLLGKHVNTYTFTKNLAEKLIATEGGDLPIAIVRPSMVLASLREPTKGWIDSWGGPTFYIYFSARGLWRVFNVHETNLGEIIPVDMCANMIIASAWKVGTERHEVGVKVYHSSTGANPTNWKFYLACAQENARKYPLDDVLWYPTIRHRRSKWATNADIFFTHMIPATLVDFALIIVGRKPKFSSTNPIRFECKNYAKLLASMSPSDVREFDFDVRKIDWWNYFEHYFLGARKYLWKSKTMDFEAGRRRIAMLKCAHYCLMGSALVASLWMASCAKNFVKSKKE